MNRYKTEQARAKNAARAGKTPAEIAELDKQEAHRESVMELAREIHSTRFRRFSTQLSK
ncbi:hypothetical protein [Marinobacter sp. S6332]|uniref:hypothetical protein n=1 Tax=Marinobacter sp. S6332 TaxID=2926403 RepID=UPI001FF2A799|nr:hypothetical protein [Marinobacter sp. S6332]MCK0165787.1 hypothetical protein [Marinobacter sp. S6332]